jgi:hypothetical protein
MAAVAGVRGTGDWAADERPKNFREYILWRNPNGTMPLLGLMSKVGKEKTDDAEFSWWDEPVDLVRLRVNKASGYGTSDTNIVVDSADPDATDANRDNNWGLATHCVAGDLLMVEPTADAAAFTVEYLEVTSVQDGTSLTVKRAAAGSTAASIPDDAYLLKIGSVFPEGTSAPKSSSRNPIKYKNYCQIFKNTYDVTKSAALTKTRTGDPLKNERKRKSYDHARDQEMALLFGRASEVNGDNGKPKRTMDGLRRFIPTKTTTVFSGAVTFSGSNNFLDAAYKVFDYDTDAGDTRIAVCGNGALNEINKVVAKDANSEIQFGESIKMYGMNLRELILPQGRLYLRTHPMLNRHSLYTKSMWLIDFSALKWRHFTGRDTDFEDNIQEKGEDVIRGQWLTEAGLEVRYGGLTCGYLGNISAT